MTSDRQLVTLRHTPVHSTPGLCYGQLDLPLALSYPADLKRVRRQLPAQSFARVLSSPLQRCHKLATDLNFGPVVKEPRLMELSFGQWEGQLWTEIPRDLSEYWTEDVVNRTPPGGESFRDLIARVSTLLQEPELWTAGPKLLLVTHAGVIRALTHLLEGVDFDTCLRRPVAFGECTVWNV